MSNSKLGCAIVLLVGFLTAGCSTLWTSAPPKSAPPPPKSAAAPPKPEKPASASSGVWGRVTGVFSWRPEWPWQEKAGPAQEVPPDRPAAVASRSGSSIEVVRPQGDARDLASGLEAQLKRRGFAVGSAQGPAPIDSQSPPRAWETDSQNALSAWHYHFVPTYNGPDARPIAKLIARDWRPPRRVRLHFDYDLDESQRSAPVVRFNATLIDVDAGTVVGHMAFSGSRSIDSVLSDVAAMVPRRLK